MLESRESPRISTLLGRDSELRRIETVLRGTRDARCGALIRVAGDPGSGKSVLLAEALRAARSDGWTVLDTRCYAGERRTPVAALRRLVARRIGGGGDDVDRYASGLQRELTSPDTSAGRFESAFAGLLEGLLVDHPTLLAFDDAQWLDRQSIAALHALLDPARGRCPAVLISHPADYEAPVLPADSHLIVSLQPLSRESSEAVVRSIWPEARPAVTAAIADRAAGLPFALAALAQRSATDGVSTPEDLAPSGQAVVREMILSLTPEQRSFVQMCSLIGDPIELRILRRLIKDDAALDRLIVECGHIVLLDGPALRFRHARVADAAQQTLTRPLVMRRRVLAACRAANTLRPADHDRIATLAASIGDVDAEFEALFALGSSAVAQDAYEAAIASFERALAVRTPSRGEFVAFYNNYAIALRQIARWKEAHHVLEAAVDEGIEKAIPSIGVLASALLWAVWIETDRESARLAYRNLRERIDDPAERQFVDAMGANLAAAAADVEDFDAIRAAMDALPSRPSRYAATTLALGTAVLMSRLGRYPDAMQAIDAARAQVDVQRSVHRFSVDCYGSQIRFRQYGCAGARIQLGWLQVRDDGSIVSETPPRMVLLYALELAAIVDLARGDWDAAMAKIDAAAPDSLVFCAARTKLLAIPAAIAALGGEPPEYARAIEDDLRNCFQRGLWHRAMPLVFWWASFLQAKRPQDAAALVQPFRDLLDHRVDSTTMHFPIARALYARRANDVELLRALAAGRFDERAPWDQAQELLATGAAFEALGDRRAKSTLGRAASAFDALEAPFFSAYAAGLNGAVSAMESDLLQALRVPVLPADRAGKPAARAHRDAEPTLREREIAMLVADGHTNRGIAERLTISERTVEVHLANVFGKLNVNSRTQLARFVLEQKFAHRGHWGSVSG